MAITIPCTPKSFTLPAAYQVPAIYEGVLQQVSTDTQVPMSWLAAVASRTYFQSNFEQLTATVGWPTIRRIGITGLWCDNHDYTLPAYGSALQFSATGRIDSGWRPYYPYALISSHPPISQFCPEMAAYPTDQLLQANLIAPPTSSGAVPAAQRSIQLAATLLKEAADRTFTVCGRLTDALWLYWLLGCGWNINRDLAGNCIVPPDLPVELQNEVAALDQAMLLYASYYCEPIWLQPPWRCNAADPACAQPVCPDGQLYDVSAQRCLCPAGTTWDPSTQSCLGGPPPGGCVVTNDCPPGMVCQNGVCVPGAPCGAGGICPSGLCCDPGSGRCGSCAPGPGGGGSALLWLGLLALLVGGGYVAATEARRRGYLV